jgi:thiamine-monophosphate kinase
VNEFEIIEKYFRENNPSSKGNLILGIGDDAAIINVSEDSELTISTDTLVSGVHFFEDASPEDIAYKALSVNLSDIAAMGALPRWVSLSLTLPKKDLDWIDRFSSTFKQLIDKHSVVLIGGDLTKGPLSISIHIHGVAPKGKSLRRSGASEGDSIYVTGYLGAAAYALNHIQEPDSYPSITEKELNRLHRPEARVKTGLELRDNATSCIDISDGLLADLGHILKASNVGAEIRLTDIPYSASLKLLDDDKAIELALTGGDDYELCFTLPKGLPNSVIEELNSICPINCIGRINKEVMQLSLINNDDKPYEIKSSAYRHFD